MLPWDNKCLCFFSGSSIALCDTVSCLLLLLFNLTIICQNPRPAQIHAITPHHCFRPILWVVPLGGVLWAKPASAASSAFPLVPRIVIGKVGWAWPGAPLGLTELHTLHLLQSTLGVGAWVSPTVSRVARSLSSYHPLLCFFPLQMTLSSIIPFGTHNNHSL